MEEFGLAGQRAGERKIWGPRENQETVDLVVTLDADSGLSDRRGGRLKCGYGNTSRGVNEVEIGGI